MKRLKNHVSWPEVMAKTGLSAGRVLAVFEGLQATYDLEAIARKYEIKLDDVKAVAAFFVEDTAFSAAPEKRPESAEAPRALKSLRKSNRPARKESGDK